VESASPAAAHALRTHLEQLKALRGPLAQRPAALAAVQRWQADRLAATYADLAAQSRYAEATAFFLEDLYGAKDFSARDEEMLRIVPVMSRVLPAAAVETAALAIELEALTEALDQRLAERLGTEPVTPEAYARAYRETSTLHERTRQIDLIDAVGQRLDALVRKPLVGATLKLMRKPARVAGLGDLQDFLERGFAAFRAMGGAGDFLAALRARETALMHELLADPPRAA
jgi:hypothetical protein